MEKSAYQLQPKHEIKKRMHCFFSPTWRHSCSPMQTCGYYAELSNVDTWGGHCLTSKCFLMVSVKADRAMYKHISMGSYVYLEPLKSAASHKIYCLLCNFTLTMKTLFQTYYLVAFARHDICQNVYTSRLGTDHILPVKV